MTRRECAADVSHLIAELIQFAFTRRIEHTDLQINRRLDSLSECLDEEYFAAPSGNRKPIPFVASHKLPADFARHDDLLSRRRRVIAGPVQHHWHVGHTDHHRRMTARKLVGETFEHRLSWLQSYGQRPRGFGERRGDVHFEAFEGVERRGGRGSRRAGRSCDSRLGGSFALTQVPAIQRDARGLAALDDVRHRKRHSRPGVNVEPVIVLRASRRRQILNFHDVRTIGRNTEVDQRIDAEVAAIDRQSSSVGVEDLQHRTQSRIDPLR